MNGYRKYLNEGRDDLTNSVYLDMVYIPEGTFLMGSPEKKGFDDEKPQRQVTVQPFYMGKYPITQSQWREIASRSDLKVERDLKLDPSNFKGDDRPVEQVSWYDTVEFCQRLSLATGKEYQLPSEAQWEYACRAGTITPFHFGKTITTNLANFNGRYSYGNALKGEYRQQTTPIGQFPSNAFGLHDMHGNVWEWCLDNWHCNYNGAPIDGSAWIDSDNLSQSRKLLRGGSWFNNPEYCRSALRLDLIPDIRVNNIGLRVVCALR